MPANHRRSAWADAARAMRLWRAQGFTRRGIARPEPRSRVIVPEPGRGLAEDEPIAQRRSA